MDTIYGLKPIDLAVIVAYFVVVMWIGFRASHKVHTDEDYFVGGRRFGKGLLTMHWLCTGTHSEQAVQVAGAAARVGMGGIWYQWMWLFSTPFYWLLAPIVRRLRVMTTGDFFRMRFGQSLEILYGVIGTCFLIFSIATLLRGAGATISGATGGEIPTEESIIVLSLLFSSYIMTGGLMAAAYTDALQGFMIIIFSCLLVPVGLAHIGGMEGMRAALPPEMFSITAPSGAAEGDPVFVIAVSLLGLVGIISQPHVVTANGAGKTEREAQIGMCYGNFIKRFLTIAWTMTGMIALVVFMKDFAGLTPGSAEYIHQTETLFGRAVQELLGDGWRGLMIACIIAGVTSAEALMVVGAGLFSRNCYAPLFPGQTPQQMLWSGRIASVAILLGGIVLAFTAESITQLYVTSIQIIALLGPAIWLGICWRRTNPLGVWLSFFVGVLIWSLTAWPIELIAAQVEGSSVASLVESIKLSHLSKPAQILISLVSQFGMLILAGLLTPSQDRKLLDAFYARLLTPIGREHEVLLDDRSQPLPESATLGMNDGIVIDYEKAKPAAIKMLQPFGLEIPRLSAFDVIGFAGAW
ncbi:MAG: sodium:solute symporter family protein, partial [Planctomycetaceae bacterium]